MLYVIYYNYDVWEFMLSSYKTAPNVRLVSLHAELSIFNRAFRACLNKLNISFSHCVLNSRLLHILDKITEDDSVLVLDYLDMNLLYNINLRLPDKIKRSLFLWNHLGKSASSLITKVRNKTRFKIFTFDQADADLFELCLVNQFFNEDFYINSQGYLYDTIFVGFDKGRALLLNEILETLDHYGVTHYKKIATSVKECVSYQEYLSLVSNCKCIIDIVKKDQLGLTLRPLEALFLNKKLITNNPNIKSYEFYNEKNIFIWGEDCIEDLFSFINSKVAEVDINVKNKFTVNTWLLNFMS